VLPEGEGASDVKGAIVFHHGSGGDFSGALFVVDYGTGDPLYEGLLLAVSNCQNGEQLEAALLRGANQYLREISDNQLRYFRERIRLLLEPLHIDIVTIMGAQHTRDGHDLELVRRALADDWEHHPSRRPLRVLDEVRNMLFGGMGEVIHPAKTLQAGPWLNGRQTGGKEKPFVAVRPGIWGEGRIDFLCQVGEELGVRFAMLGCGDDEQEEPGMVWVRDPRSEIEDRFASLEKWVVRSGDGDVPEWISRYPESHCFLTRLLRYFEVKKAAVA